LSGSLTQSLTQSRSAGFAFARRRSCGWLPDVPYLLYLLYLLRGLRCLWLLRCCLWLLQCCLWLLRLDFRFQRHVGGYVVPFVVFARPFRRRRRRRRRRKPKRHWTTK
jgi:hypothetical protein